MKISTLLDYIDSGHMALPEFQRGYVWNRDQVRGLFDSLYRRHPVGGLLVWVTESDTAAHHGDGPQGIQEELSQPVAVLLYETGEVVALASQAGFRCFTSVEGFRQYVQDEVLHERPAD